MFLFIATDGDDGIKESTLSTLSTDAGTEEPTLGTDDGAEESTSGTESGIEQSTSGTTSGPEGSALGTDNGTDESTLGTDGGMKDSISATDGETEVQMTPVIGSKTGAATAFNESSVAENAPHSTDSTATATEIGEMHTSERASTPESLNSTEGMEWAFKYISFSISTDSVI